MNTTLVIQPLSYWETLALVPSIKCWDKTPISEGSLIKGHTLNLAKFNNGDWVWPNAIVQSLHLKLSICATCSYDVILI